MDDFVDPVEYVVRIRHWHDGDLDIRVEDVGSSSKDRAAIAWALRKAADEVETREVATTAAN